MAVATPQAPSAARTSATVAAAREDRAAAGLLLALVVVSGYAAFARGAIQQPDEARLQVLLVLLGLLGGALWFSGLLTLRASGTGLAGLALLAAFAAWTGLTLAWSVAPDSTWAELNRWMAYALTATLALACGTSVVRARERLALAWLAVGSVVAGYALATKLVPGLHVGGVIDLNQQAVFSRLRSPLDYWNALALVCVLMVPIAAAMAADTSRSARARLAAHGALLLAFVVGAMTFSRGGVLAAVVAVAALAVLGDRPVNSLVAVGLAGLAAAPPLAFAFTSHTLTSDGASLSSREGAGAILAAIVLASLAAMLVAARRLPDLGARIAWPRMAPRTLRRGGAVAGATAAAVLIAIPALSARGLTGSIGHAITSFTSPHRDPITDPSRLLSTNSGNRWVWWEEAAGAWWDRPLGGWGAGSFPVVHLMYRKPPPLPVRQPHDVPLQLLAETGLAGALLALGALGALLAAALARLRAMPAGRERQLTAALIAAALGWMVHGLFDWDTDIPAVTLPALLFLGVAAARPVRRDPRVLRAGGPLVSPRARRVLLGLGSLLACAAAVSAILPAWSQSKAEAALTAAADATRAGQLQDAAEQADVASRLDPLAVQPLLDAAAIAQRRGRLADVRRYLLAAVQRDPHDAQAWTELAYYAVDDGDGAGGLRAAQRALALDPLNPQLIALARAAARLQVPPAASPTATGTPLGAAGAAPGPHG